MYFKNFEIIFTFITFALLVFSSPIKVEKEKINKNSLKSIKPTENIKKITKGLSIVEAKSNYDLVELSSLCELTIDDNCIKKILNTTEVSLPHLDADGMKGSTFSVPKKGSKGYYVGRNLDLKDDIQNLILVNYPEEHYSSISTVNPDFIKQFINEKDKLSEEVLTLIPFLVTLDGLNEKGVSISVNMNQGDVKETELNPYKLFHFNVSFLMRSVLDYASSTDKAIDVIRGFELLNDFDFNVHFMISDASGKSVVVEYVYDKKKKTNNMVVTESSIVTNFNIAKGKKSNSGKKQYDIIKKMTKTTRKMNANDVKNTLKAAKHNTQYSIVYDLNNREAIYYVRENYNKGYKVQFNLHHDDTLPLNPDDDKDSTIVDINLTNDLQRFGEKNFTVFEYKGDYGFKDFMNNGGAVTEMDIVKYVYEHHGFDFPYNNTDDEFPINGNACSAFTVKNDKGNGYFFGRNYDFPNGKALAVVTRPKDGYASISTVDYNFITWLGQGNDTDTVITSVTSGQDVTSNLGLPDEILKELVVYTPFDGMNEKGLSITLNMVPQGSEFSFIDQNNKNKVNLTMTTLIRYLLDTAATVDEAVKKIKSINMHNHYVHFLISDATGKTVAIEFKNEGKKGVKMYVVKTPIVTNYFLADDEELKSYNFEILSDDRRYDSILDRLTKKPKQSLKDVRNTLRSANQEITIWSAAFDKAKKEVTYFIN